MMHRDGWTGPRAPSNTDYAWFCWDRDHQGPAIVDQILWVSGSAPTERADVEGAA
jgi:hypothetical protein